MADPSFTDLRAFLTEHTQTEAARRFYPDLSESAGRSRVQRILKAGADTRGAVERSVDTMIATWGPLDPEKHLRADLIRSLANTADWSRNVHTGQGRTAGIQAATALWKFLEDMGQSSGMDDLRKFLEGDDDDPPSA